MTVLADEFVMLNRSVEANWFQLITDLLAQFDISAEDAAELIKVLHENIDLEVVYFSHDQPFDYLDQLNCKFQFAEEFDWRFEMMDLFISSNAIWLVLY